MVPQITDRILIGSVAIWDSDNKILSDIENVTNRDLWKEILTVKVHGRIGILIMFLSEFLGSTCGGKLEIHVNWCIVLLQQHDITIVTKIHFVDNILSK